MSLEDQIHLISNPQEFTRLYDAVLKAKHGDDFLEIDDDRPDRGNDGYLKSERKMFAGHCFKRLANQSIDGAIRAKMTSDLNKAIALKRNGSWNIDAWTFISNYPIPNDIAHDIFKLGESNSINVSWRGSAFLALELQERPGLRALFPFLQVNELAERVANLEVMYRSAESTLRFTADAEYYAPSSQEIESLIADKPSNWEYSLFASLLQQDRAKLNAKLLDHELFYAPRLYIHLGEQESIQRLSEAFTDLKRITKNIELILTPDSTGKAFGQLDEPGNVARISHVAQRVIGCVEEYLQWAATLRGLGLPDHMAAVYESAAELANQPISEILAFVDEMATMAADLPRIIAEAGDESPVLSKTLRVTIDPGALEKFHAELERLKD